MPRADSGLRRLCCHPPQFPLTRRVLQAERVEVERLRGLVDLLRKRCDDLECTVESSARALRNERARAVDLERRAESAGGAKRQGGLGGKPSTPGADKVGRGHVAYVL
jgi:hypothetical protein